MDMDDTYGDLDPTRREIRLLRLFPGNWEEPLRGELQVASLDDPSRYQALSYVWGNPNIVKTIQLHGKLFYVTANLWAALRRLRRSHHERILWIDAVCINQRDLKERSHQVNVMGDIFSRASQVFIWLGDSITEEDNSLAASPGTLEDGKDFDWLCKNFEQTLKCSALFDHESETLAAFGILYLLSIDTHWTNKLVFADVEGQYHVAKGFLSRWHAALKLFQVPWWSRVWTIQEVVLAKQATVVVGSVSAPWELFYNFYQSYMNHLPPGACCHDSMTWTMTRDLWDEIVLMRFTIWSFYECRTGPRTIQPHAALWENLWLFRHKAATDPRDKVYALLGLLHSQQYPFLSADYSISNAETFSRCTEALIKSDNNLRALIGPRLHQPGLPTWVMDFLPEFSSEGVMFFQNIFKRITSSVIFNACPMQALRYSVESRNLSLYGFAIDKVKDTAMAMGVGCEAAIFREWENLSCSHDEFPASAYPTECTRADAYWRAIIRDTIRDYQDGEKIRRAKSTDEASYLRFRRWITHPSDTEAVGDPDYENFRRSFFIATQHQQFFTTCKGYIGLSDTPQPNDEIWILYGGNVPFMLRPHPENSEKAGSHVLVGDCYVHGIMDGEAMKGWEERDTRQVFLV
jgi:hypothetical protein